MEEIKNVDQKIERINGQLYDTLIIKDDQENELQRINVPLKVELRLHDIMEILVGASILAVPVAFTEEVWNMGDELPWLNVFLLSLVALLPEVRLEKLQRSNPNSMLSSRHREVPSLQLLSLLRN